LGFFKYCLALDFWLEKTGLIFNKVDNLPIRFGSFTESFVASKYATQTGFALAHNVLGYRPPAPQTQVPLIIQNQPMLLQ
jgi:predicted phage-related endonuclease